jgi:hypothetical protein
MKFPKQIKVEQDKTHRLIPYRYSDRGRPILNLLAQDDDDLLSDLTELEGATNDRLLGESPPYRGRTSWPHRSQQRCGEGKQVHRAAAISNASPGERRRLEIRVEQQPC